jgi:G3E family GTPase
MNIFLVGGFLGSGKTTAIGEGCRELSRRGTKVAVITNDQGNQLVDTAWVEQSGVPALEVSDGCFCCHFEKLADHLETLVQKHSPEVIFAESVGSCTDLVATVLKPLRAADPQRHMVLSVFADALVLPHLIRGSRLFADSVQYIYRKQLEEADLLVISKVDLLREGQLEELRQLVRQQFPDKKVIYQNSLDRTSMGRWLESLFRFEAAHRKSLSLDYDLYADGEAELAWYDAEMEVSSGQHRAVEAAYRFIQLVCLEIRHLAVGHVKFLLHYGDKQEKISFTSAGPMSFLLREDAPAAATAGMLINARVQTTPSHLKEIMGRVRDQVQQQSGCRLQEGTIAAFQPGYPRPTYRMVE